MTSDTFRVTGGISLSGDIHPQGAKNEALQILCATLLTDEEVVVKNIPDILDIRRQIQLLKVLGVKVTKISSNHYRFQANQVAPNYFESKDYIENATKIRGSVMLIGPLLARFNRAILPRPGGDKIGRRRLDTHFNALEKLGAEIRYDEVQGAYDLSTQGLKANYILMDEISVTGTANVLMAAVFAKGTTQIYNAACEPYLQQLSKMLVRMGAQIEGIGSNLLVVTGVDQLHGTEHTVLPDMIEIGSFVGLASMTQSKLTIRNAAISELGVILPTFRKLGLNIVTEGDDIIVDGSEPYEISSFRDGSILTIYDAPWPGLTPDLMSILLVVATQAKGSVLIHQKMFESRLFFVDKLIDMGAKIILCDPHRATVIGLNRETQLKGITMSSPDIRAGVSLLIAALSAQGTSIIHNVNQIDRGYEAIDTRLNKLGAQIERI